jgi:hypothetical protein
MSDLEKLSFKIALSGTYWKRRPEYSVWVNDEKIVQNTINAESDQIEHVEFEHEVTEGTYLIKIRLENKTPFDTVENADKTAIVKDMLLNIHSIEIDEIDLANLIYTSKFVADDADRPTLERCVNLGWNGTYQLEFASPFYIWLLENI